MSIKEVTEYVKKQYEKLEIDFSNSHELNRIHYLINSVNELIIYANTDKGFNDIPLTIEGLTFLGEIKELTDKLRKEIRP